MSNTSNVYVHPSRCLVKHVLVHFIKFSLKVHRVDFIFNLLAGTAINFLWAHKKLPVDPFSIAWLQNGGNVRELRSALIGIMLIF